MKRFKRFMSLLICAAMALIISLPAYAADTDSGGDYPFVFVYGMSGWGRENPVSLLFPYWGMTTGSTTDALNAEGYTCVEASVAPNGSAWDRACELYAQLTGTTVDYGAAHSAQYGHERFGKTYTEPLVEGWGENGGIKINLIGHSFGGATIRLMESLLRCGSAEEQAASGKDGLSPLFEGGRDKVIFSITAIASPHNVISLFNAIGDWFADYLLTSAKDTVMCDLTISGAKKINSGISINDSIYYFSMPTDTTMDSVLSPNRVPKLNTFPILMITGTIIGAYDGKVIDGVTVDESWKANDGLVNTVSAKSPLNEPSTELDAANIERGIWNVMPTVSGTHWYITGLTLCRTGEYRDTYSNLLEMISAIGG